MTRDEFERKRQERRRKIRKRRLKAFFTVFLLLSVAVGVVLSLTVLFPIKEIKITGSEYYSAEEISDNCGIKVGDNIFTASRAKTEELLKSRLPYIEKVAFKRNISGELKITVKDAQEYAAYLINKEYYKVSQDNWVLAKADKKPADLITVKISDVKCKVGSKAEFGDASQKQLLDSIVNCAENAKVSLNYVDISSVLDINIKVEGRFTVDLGTSNNLEEKFNHLAKMIEEIGQKKSGNINLSMWTSTDSLGTFKEKSSKK